MSGIFWRRFFIITAMARHFAPGSSLLPKIFLIHRRHWALGQCIHYCNPSPLRLLTALVAASIFTLGVSAQEPTITPEMLAGWVKQYPQADANKDGLLTEAEARGYYAKILAVVPSNAPAPTRENVVYGLHERNAFDFWAASSDQPTALVVYIHGGGFVSGDKKSIRSERLVPQCLQAGVSVAAINYRYLSSSVPLQDVLGDTARAVQFLRAHATEFNLDKTRIAACGHSAGAGSALWLAFHDDMADSKNPDPVLRESTRLSCAVSWDGQFTYDLPGWGKYFGEANRRKFGGIYNSPELYGLKTLGELNDSEGRKRRAACDFYAMISPDDPPVYLGSGLPTTAIENVNQYLHNPRHSQLIYDRCLKEGVIAVAKIPALKIFPAPADPPYGESFMFKYLAAKSAQ